jgi:hypothetical protein
MAAVAQAIGQIRLRAEQLVLALAAPELQVLVLMDRSQPNQDH